jgi:histone H3/H4
MDDDAKAPYHERAAAEKEKYGVYMKEALARGDQFTLEGGPGTGKPSGTTGPLDMVYPAAKVRKICKLDPEVKNVSREALQLIVKAAELFTVAIGKESVKVARFNNRRKLLPEDVAHVCVHRDAFTFLKDDVKDLVRWQREAARKEKKQKESAAKEAAAVAAKDSDGADDGDDSAEKKSTTKRMTDYFSSASASASN